jgi:hypothetical protein
LADLLAEAISEGTTVWLKKLLTRGNASKSPKTSRERVKRIPKSQIRLDICIKFEKILNAAYFYMN